MANNRELSQLASFVTVNDTSKTIAFGSTVASLNVAGVVTATTFSGNVTGNVTGNLTGDVTGNLTGDVTGVINTTGVGTITRLEATDINVSGASTIGIVTALDIQNANVTNTFISNQASVLSGRVGTAASHSNITAIGYSAGASLVGTGYSVYDNTFIGACAGSTTTDGYLNTAVGSRALFSNTTGRNNTAIGSSSLASLTTGIRNTALGNNSACTLSTGCYNTFIGEGSGALINGTNNTALGLQSMINTTGGNGNIAVGVNAQCSAGSRSYNTVMGFCGGRDLSSGSCNTLIGAYVALGVTSGNNNIAIGQSAGNDAVWDFSASVGAGASSNVIVIGNNDHDTAYIKIDWTVTSDERDKEIEGPVPHGLAFVQALEPIKFQFKNRETDELSDNVVRYGFSAQQIAELEGNPTVIANTVDPENLKVTGAHLVPVLVNAIKELSAKVAELEARLDAQ